MSLKNALSALALGLAFVSSASANTLTYQGVTFNTWAIDADSMGLSILNAPSATGNWTGVSFLKAFEVKGIGDITGASISPSQFAVTADHGLSANIGCSTGGTPGACFSASTPISLTSNMTWTIDFTGTNLNFSAPHLKVQFLTNLNDDKATGSILSQNIPAVPEPETYAMLLAGIGMMGAIARRRKFQAA